MSQTAVKPSLVLYPILGIVGLFVLLYQLLGKRTPQAVISRILDKRGLSPQMIKFWTAVSAYETAYPYDSTAKPWNSPVLRDSNNLFNLIVPGTKRLQYGEGQTIYDRWDPSVEDLVDRVMKPFKYPANVVTLEDLVDAMKDRGYFLLDRATYKAGARKWYDKLYPQG